MAAAQSVIVSQIKLEQQGHATGDETLSTSYFEREYPMSSSVVGSSQLPMDHYTGDGSSSPPISPSSEHPESYCISSTMPTFTQSEGKILDVPKKMCLVCGDVASGFHYGVASCEACKAFFKRTIQGNIEYTCPGNSDCEINKRRRKACQACRYDKCLRVGMLKEGVRLDRVRGGRQKYKRGTDHPYQMSLLTNKKPSLEDNMMFNALLSYEPDTINAHPNSSLVPLETPLQIMSFLAIFIDKELVSTISWAKNIPGFIELTLNDQMRLLQNTWAEIQSLSLAFRSRHHRRNVLMFAPDYSIDETQAIDLKLETYFNNCMILVGRLDQLSVTREEFVVLKALILTNADILLENDSTVRALRENIYGALTECVTVTRNNPNFVGQLMMCLPLIRQLQVDMRGFWTKVQQESKVPMNKLFLEMLDNCAFSNP